MQPPSPKKTLSNVTRGAIAGYAPSELERYVECELAKAPDRMARLGRFVDDCCEFDPDSVLPYSVVLAKYREWCKAHGEVLCRARELPSILRARGHMTARGWVVAIALRPGVPDPEPEDEWSSVTTMVQSGFPRLSLQAMRENAVGPRWRLRGHEIQYHVASLREWLSESRFAQRAGRVEAIIAAFVEQCCDFRIGNWQRCAVLSERCRQWCVANAGAVPVGMRRELWLQLLARGCKRSHRRLEDHKQGRTVEGVCLL